MINCEFDRRQFLKWTGASVAAAVATQLSMETLANAASASPLAAKTPILVLVTLYGGNDGLNMVVPFTDPVYKSVRSNIALPSSQLLPISGSLAFNSSMPSINTLFHHRKVAIVQGVSYPNPNLSHFSSMAIWQSASLTGLNSGWIGRWLDQQPHSPFNAIGVGSTLPPAFVGNQTVASMVDVGGMQLPWGSVSAVLPRLGATSRSDVALEAAAATSIHDLYSTATRIGPHIPKSPSGSWIGQQLALVAALINANVPTRVWEVNLSSFDTHTGEVGDQNALLAEVDTAIGDFMTKIGAGSRSHDVTLMVYSEFGRRVQSNASDGTDHGTSAPVLLIGNRVKGGLYGEQPPLKHLDPNGNLKVTTDFRSVYGGLLHDVLATPVNDIIPSWKNALSVH
ncbi:MAG: DUF1501 domain-containing protein [Actinomycetota bacterium]|jgi:uncharacterized protein (DUF1501 family)|nr:DUF1501 domain-containing protein [Actinomycetota bacterium]